MNQSINIHIRAILLMALMLLMPSMMWADKETWVEYADGTLTFHYDENQDSCSNQTYSLPASGEDPDWLVHKSDITEVVFSEALRMRVPSVALSGSTICNSLLTSRAWNISIHQRSMT